MKQSRAVPIVRSVVVLGLVSVGLTSAAAAQSPQTEESASSSSSLFMAPPPDAPSTVRTSPFSGTQNSGPAKAARQRTETSVSLGVFSQLSTSRIFSDSTPPGIFITESLNPTAGVLGTFRQSFRPWLGYAVNFGYTSTVQHITHSQGSGFGITSNDYLIPNNSYEISTTYLAQTKLRPKLTGFAEAGGGVLIVQPTQNLMVNGASREVPKDYRPLGVFGAGVDYHFNPQFAFRAEYRGQVYKYADFGFGLAPRFYNLSSEPTVSLTYTFGKGKYHQ